MDTVAWTDLPELSGRGPAMQRVLPTHAPTKQRCRTGRACGRPCYHAARVHSALTALPGKTSQIEAALDR